MIRPLTPADIPTLRAMLQALSDHDGGTHPVASEQVLRHAAFVTHLIHALIHPDGMVIYFPDYSTHRGRPGLTIQDLYVTPNARGTGLARALLAASLRHQTWSAQYVTLGVSPGNLAATRFYAKSGFTSRGYQMMILDGTNLEQLR